MGSGYILPTAPAFHTTYKTNLDAWQAGNKANVEAQWRQAFAAAESEQGGSWYLPRSTEILNSLLPSMQAHIRVDLPRAIAACFVTHYAGIPGTSLGDFRGDFDAMGPVFDLATEDMSYEAAAPPPSFPEKLFFKLDHPRQDSEKLEDAIRDDQDLAPYVELARWTRTVRGARIHLIGQASDEGTEQHNKELATFRTFALQYFLFKFGADLTNNEITIENRGEEGATNGPSFRFVQVDIQRVGTGRQQHHAPNGNLPSEVAP